MEVLSFQHGRTLKLLVFAAAFGYPAACTERTVGSEACQPHWCLLGMVQGWKPLGGTVNCFFSFLPFDQS